MSDRARRAGGYGRAAAEPLLDELASQAAELSKRWAIALIESREPGRIAAVDLTLLASDGPEVIDAVLSAAARGPAAGEDGAGAGRGTLARIAGSGGSGELARAAEALRSVLWEAAVEASPRARSDTRAARRLLELGDTLANACAELLAGELDAAAGQDDRSARASGTRAVTASAVEAAAADAEGAPGAGLRGPTTEPIVIVDERGRTESGSARPAGRSDPGRLAEMVAARPPEPAAGPDAPIAAGDLRHQQGPAAWIGSIGTQLEAFEQDGRSFAVLLIEILEPPAAAGAALVPALEHSIEERVGAWRGLTLTRERPGRYWLLAPGADGAGAEILRERLEAPAGEGGAGGPVAVGVAVCPADGRDAAGLAAAADLDLYTSRARSSRPPARRTGSS